MLAVLLVAVGGFTAWRVADRLAEPSPGDQYEVTFTVDHECEAVSTSTFDGLVAEGNHAALRTWAGGEGRGTITLKDVHALSHGEGIGFTGTLATDDGLTIHVDGGTEGEYFSDLTCMISG
jgi:hypothetical protein